MNLSQVPMQYQNDRDIKNAELHVMVVSVGLPPSMAKLKKSRGAAALSKHSAHPFAERLRARGAFFCRDRPAAGKRHNDSTPHGSAAIAGSSPALRFPWLIECVEP